MGLNQNTWKLNQWYDQDVAGNVSYSGSAGLFVWGYNEKGQLGQNNQTEYSSPVQIPGTTWEYVSNGKVGDTDHMLSTKTDGTIWAWGHATSGQLGNNATAQYQFSSPIQIPGTTWGQQISRGHASCFAIKTDGTIWAWGDNTYGQLGQNEGGAPGTRYSSPVQIPGTTWRTVKALGYGCVTTKTDGTLWMWGKNDYGQLGQNDGVSGNRKSSPVQIPGTDWGTAVDGGSQFTLGIKTDGTLWGWGVNEYGMLGQNHVAARSSPIQIGTETTWSKIGCNNKGVSAIKTDGTLWVWGSNADGRLGLNQAETPGALGYSSPVQLGSDTTWDNVIGGTNNTIASKTDGTLWGWSWNNYGQLAQNNTVQYSSPVQISGSWNTGDEKFGAIYNGGVAAIANQ